MGPHWGCFHDTKQSPWCWGPQEAAVARNETETFVSSTEKIIPENYMTTTFMSKTHETFPKKWLQFFPLNLSNIPPNKNKSPAFSCWSQRWHKNLLWSQCLESINISSKRQVVAWNTLLFVMTWWLFGFHTFELLQVQRAWFFGWEEMCLSFFLGSFGKNGENLKIC